MQGKEQEEQHVHHVIQLCGRLWAESRHHNGAWLAASTGGDSVWFRKGHLPLMRDENLMVGRDATSLVAFQKELEGSGEAMTHFRCLLWPLS